MKHKLGFPLLLVANILTTVTHATYLSEKCVSYVAGDGEHAFYVKGSSCYVTVVTASKVTWDDAFTSCHHFNDALIDKGHLAYPTTNRILHRMYMIDPTAHFALNLQTDDPAHAGSYYMAHPDGRKWTLSRLNSLLYQGRWKLASPMLSHSRPHIYAHADTDINSLPGQYYSDETAGFSGAYICEYVDRVWSFSNEAILDDNKLHQDVRIGSQLSGLSQIQCLLKCRWTPVCRTFVSDGNLCEIYVISNYRQKYATLKIAHGGARLYERN